MAALYADENFPLPAVEELRNLGHDVLTSAEAGQAGRAVPDTAVLAFAAASSRTLLTMDRRDFIRLHLAGSPHCGIVVATFDSNFAGLARRIDAALPAAGPPERALIRVSRPS